MEISDENLEKVLNNRSLRIELVTESFEWFIAIYLNHHFSYAFAPYHKKLMRIIQDPTISRAYIAAFRASGKTTLITHASVLWSVFGKPQKKYVVMIGLTKPQIEEHFGNIRKELENNTLLINDFGEFKTTTSKATSDIVELPSLGAKIVAKSRGETIRGAKEGSSRPDYIVCDDLDDVNTAKTIESREDLMTWFNSEVMTLGFDDLRVIVTGNIVHPDCFLVRVEEYIKNSDKQDVFLKIPFYNEQGHPNWPARFPTQESVNNVRDNILDPRVWKREYELVPVTLKEQIIKEEDINYYEQTPLLNSSNYKYTLFSVDPAATEKTTSDYCAIVFADVFENNDEVAIYIRANEINEKMNPQVLLNRIEAFYKSDLGSKLIVLMESVSFQDLLVTQLERKGLLVERVTPRSQSKTDRLITISPWIKSGVVKFSKSFGGSFRDQVLYCGMTRNDDLLDAFVYLVQYVMEDTSNKNTVIAMKCRNPRDVIYEKLMGM